MKTKFIIDRSTWRCGNFGDHAIGIGETAMENEEGFKCCLGHIQSQIDDRIILKHTSTPYSSYDASMSKKIINAEELHDAVKNNPLLMDKHDLPSYMEKFHDSELSSSAMAINDREEITLEEREKQLKELFAKNDIELEFISEPQPFKIKK